MARPRKPENETFFQFKLPNRYKKFLFQLALENNTTMAELLNAYIEWLIETNNPPIGFSKTLPEPVKQHIVSD